MPRSAILSFIYKAFSPPFSTLPVLVWSFFLWCFLIHPDSPLVSGAFWDSDDYMHFVRVIDWLEGQSWFDPVLYRLAPPEGVAIHYSRLAELPLALIMWPLHASGLEWRLAAYLTACIYPLVLFAVFLKTVFWVAKEIIDPAWARITVFAAAFAPFLTFQFVAGRVDHHGLAVILTLMAFGCVLRLIRQPEKWLWSIGAAFFLALGVSIALEVLLWVLFFALCVGAGAVWGRREHALAGGVFGIALFAFSNVLLALAVKPSAFFDMNPLAFSYLYVALAGAMAFVFLFAAAMSTIKNIWVRGGGVAFFALVIGGVFLASSPELLAGPYGGVDPQLAALLFPNISEALPKIKLIAGWGRMFVLILGTLVALGVSLWATIKARGHKRVVWLILSLAIALSLGLSLFYQQRVTLYAQLFSVFPFAYLFHRGWIYVGQTKQGRRRFAAELGLILLVGPLFGVLVPALSDGRSFSKGVLLFPIQGKQHPKSMSHGVWFVLSDPQYFGDRPRRIIGMMDDGAEILFHTKHSVFAAPYHTNVKGNLQGAAFFTANDPKESLKIARELGAEMVLLPKVMGAIYVNRNDEISINTDGEQVLSSKASFAEQLASDRIPDWLAPVRLPFLQGYKLFEIKKDAQPLASGEAKAGT